MASGASTPPVVLVADDEDGVRKMLAMALKSQGFATVLCADGQAALAAIDEADGGGSAFDAALLDIRMPRMDGLALVRVLRTRPDGRALPVVVMSAYNDALQRREVLEAGADGFLPKPFTIAQLRSTLDDAIGLRGA